MDRDERLQHQLETQSSQIERVFSAHQLDAQVVSGQHTNDRTRFDFVAQLGAGWNALRNLKEDLIRALRVPAVNLYRDQGRLRLEVVQPAPAAVELFALLDMLPPQPAFSVPLGVMDEGQPLLFDFSAEAVEHVLIAGAAGAGKSALMRTMAVSLALHSKQAQLQMVIIDPAARDTSPGDTLRSLDYLPHLMMPVVPNAEAASEALRFLVDEAQYRIERERQAPRIIVFIDSFDGLLEEPASLALDAVTYLLQHGSEAGIQLVLGTRTVRKIGLGNLLKSHLTVRLVGQMANGLEAVAASGIRNSLAERLLGQGDFVSVTAENVVYFQSAYVGDYDFRLALQQLHRRRGPALLARPIGVRPNLVTPTAQPPRSFTVEPQSGSVTFDDDSDFLEFGG